MLQGQYKKAEALLEKSLNMYTKRIGEKQPYIANIQNNLGLLYMLMGKNDNAKLFLTKAMNLKLKKFGEKHPDVATSQDNLAKLYLSIGNYEKAEILFNKALIVREKMLDKNHPDLAYSLTNIANLYVEKSRVNSKESFTHRLKSYYQKNAENFSKAEELYRRALEKRELKLVQNHQLIEQTLILLANVYNVKGNIKKAEELDNRAVKIRQNRALLKKEHEKSMMKEKQKAAEIKEHEKILEKTKLTIRSNVYNDVVYIDDKKYSSSPVTIELPIGNHIVRVEKPGYGTFVKPINLKKELVIWAKLKQL